MSVIFAKFPLLSKIQPLSHKLLSDKLLPPHLHSICPETYMQGFSSDFEQFFWSNTTLFAYFERTNMASKLPSLKNC